MHRTVRTTLLVLLLAAPAVAVLPTQFMEDFSTHDYRDLSNTTAIWNTTDGVIRIEDYPCDALGTYDPTGLIFDAQPYGQHVLLAAESYLVVDVADPTTPTLVGVGSVGGNARRITAAGRFAYVACGPDGVYIFDVGDLPTSSHEGTWTGAVNALDVEVSGPWAYVADGTGMQVVGIADPTAPTTEGRVNRTSNAVAVAGDVVYSAAGSFGLMSIGVRDHSAPEVFDNLLVGAPVVDVAVAGDYAYCVAGQGGFCVVDVSDPTAMVLVEQIQANDAVGVHVDGEFAYVADRTYGMVVYDLRDPANPDFIGGRQTAAEVYAGVPSGRRVYMCDGAAGLHVLEGAGELPTPFFSYGPSIPDRMYDVAVAGRTAYVAADELGLYAVDIGDPSAPVELDRLGGYRAQYVAVHGNLVCFSSDDGPLVVVDVSDPSNLTVTDTATCNGDVAMDGYHLYAVRDGSLYIYGLGNPASIDLLDTYSSPYFHLTAIAQDGNYVAGVTVEDGGSSIAGISVFEVRDPTSISYVGLGSGWTGLTDIALYGTTIYTASLSGVRVHAINPGTDTPELVVQDDSTIQNWSVARHGDRLYVGGLQGVHVFDVAVPGVLTHLETHDTPVWSLAPWGDYLLLGPMTLTDFATLEILQRRYDLSENRAQSIEVYSGESQIVAVNLEADYLGGYASWDVQTGYWWDDVAANNGWREVSPGSSLRWRADLVYNGDGVNPTCTSLDLQWRFRNGMITGVEDVPNDQGRQVRLRWLRSGYDGWGYSERVTSYAVYRRIDDPVRAPDGADDKAYPPGDWEFLLTVPAAYEDEYAVIVPTLADSTVADGLHLSTFFVRAFTEAGLRYDSPVESGWSVDNLAPSAPTGLLLAGGQLAWDDPVDADFDYFTIYGSPTVDPADGEVLGHTVGTGFDAGGAGHAWLLVTATDFSGNEGPAAAAETATGAGDVPGVARLLGAAPNPFNPSTTIRFELPAAGTVDLVVYDLSGRAVRTLLRDDPRAPGRHGVDWDGRDDAGRALPAGVYAYRFATGRTVETRRVALVK